MLKRNYLLLSLAVLLSTVALAQLPERPGPDPDLIPDFRKPQHEKWLKGEDPYPAKPRSMWQVGVNTGMLRVFGDVRSKFGYGYGLTVRKALGYSFSLRLQYLKGNAYGANWMPSYGIANNAALNGQNDPAVDYYDEVNHSGFVYHNFKAKMNELSVDGILNLNNIRFHSSKISVSPYFLVGVGGMWYDTFLDQLDSNGDMYDYESSPVKSDNYKTKSTQWDYVHNIWDGTYETPAEINPDRYRFQGHSSDIVLSAGVGADFRLSKRFVLSFEHKIGLVDDDLLDGQRWEEPQTATNKPTLTSNNDAYHYTSIGLGINLGKKATEPEWLINPLDYVYQNLDYLEKKTNFDDGDNDGVPDLWDEELNTPEGAPVDAKGRTKDSDGDGCPDYDDPEPFSSPSYPIVDCKTQWPEGLSEERVKELIRENARGWYLPSIHFNTDKADIRAEDYENMAQIASILQRYPKMKVDVIGNADTRYTEEYNLELSKKRAENAVQFLVDNYGIDKSRFNIKYLGESNPLVKDAHKSNEHFMNRRVEFKIAD